MSVDTSNLTCLKLNSYFFSSLVHLLYFVPKRMIPKTKFESHPTFSLILASHPKLELLIPSPTNAASISGNCIIYPVQDKNAQGLLDSSLSIIPIFHPSASPVSSTSNISPQSLLLVECSQEVTRFCRFDTITSSLHHSALFLGTLSPLSRLS